MKDKKTKDKKASMCRQIGCVTGQKQGTAWEDPKTRAFATNTFEHNTKFLTFCAFT